MLTQFYYQSHGKRERLPDWAKFFIDLGSAVTKYPQPSGPLRIVLSLPTRTLSSPLIALGIVLQRASTPVSPQDEITYFNYLSGLQIGTKLSFLTKDGGRRVTGSFEGLESLNGIQALRIRTKDTVFFKFPTMVGTVFLAPEESTETGARGRRLRDGLASVKPYVDPNAYRSFVLQSRMDCMVIGPSGVIQDELQQATLYPSPTGQPIYVSEVIRVRSLLGAPTAFRSELIPPSAKHAAVQHDVPFIVILDGPSAVMKWTHRFKGSHQIIIIDRTDRSLDELISAVQDEFVTQRIDVNPTARLPFPPAGIEILAYEVEK